MLRFSRLILVVLFVTVSACAVEKYWIADEATLIVVGTLHPHPTFPWFDGWHLTGTIDVDEVLIGARPPGRIAFEYVCGYSWCRNWPPPAFTGNLTAKGIWFLRPVDGGRWEPSIGPWVGFATLNERADYENYIRRYKQRR